MPNRIIFSEGSGLADSIYGNVQAPVRLLLEKRAEAYEQKSLLGEMFALGTSTNFGDLYTSLTEMDDFEPVGENGAYPSTSMQEGHSKLIVYETWKNQFTVSQEMVEDSKLLDLKQRPSKFVASYYRTRERYGAALYGAALNGQKTMTYSGKQYDVTTADKAPLFSDKHKPKVSGPDQCNCYQDAFDVTALDRAESIMQDFRDDNGNILAVAPDTIVIPNDPDLKRKVFAAIGADQDPLTTNNAFNYQYGRWTVMVWGYLNQYIKKGSACPWMLMDSSYLKEYVAAPLNDRVPLSVKSIIDPNTDANKWNGRARFAGGFVDFRYILAGGLTGGKKLDGTGA